MKSTYLHKFPCSRSAIDRRRPGGKGRRIPSGLISKTGDFVEEKLGGGIVESVLTPSLLETLLGDKFT